MQHVTCNIGHIKYKSNHEMTINVTQTLNQIIKSKKHLHFKVGTTKQSILQQLQKHKNK